MIYLVDHIKDVEGIEDSRINIDRVSLEYVRHVLLHNEFRTNFNSEDNRYEIGQDIFLSESLENMQESCYFKNAADDVVFLAEVPEFFNDGISVRDDIQYREITLKEI